MVLKRFAAGQEHLIWALCGLSVFLLLSGLVVSRHEMWADELQHWTEPSHSHNLKEFFINTSYDRHQKIWDFTLFLLSRLTPSPLIMQWFHWLIAGLNAFLFLLWAPFRRRDKLLFVFGYFLFFEYAVLARCYAYGVLALLLFLRVRAKRPDRPIIAGLLLALLAITSIHATIVAVAIATAWGVETLISKTERRSLGAWVGIGLVVLGVALAYLQQRAPSDVASRIQSSAILHWDPVHVRNVLALPAQAFFPLPRFTFHFWDTSVFEYLPGSVTLEVVVSFLILAYALWRLRKQRMGLLIFSLGTILLLGFFYIVHYGLPRHHGFIFLLFLAALWTPAPKTGPADGPTKPRPWSRDLILTLVLATHFIGGVYANGMDFRYPFSQAKHVAQLIKNWGLASMPIAGENDYAVMPIAGYLDRPIYYPRSNRTGTFVIWDKREMYEAGTMDRLKAWTASQHRPALLILSWPAQVREKNFKLYFNLKKIATAAPAIVEWESYTLYWISADKGGSSDRNHHVKGAIANKP